MFGENKGWEFKFLYWTREEKNLKSCSKFNCGKVSSRISDLMEWSSCTQHCLSFHLCVWRRSVVDNNRIIEEKEPKKQRRSEGELEYVFKWRFRVALERLIMECRTMGCCCLSQTLSSLVALLFIKLQRRHAEKGTRRDLQRGEQIDQRSWSVD